MATNNPVEDLLDFARNLALNAGQVLMRYYGASPHVSFKSHNPRDLVSEADMETEQFITGSIREGFPTHAIIAEEGGSSGGQSQYTWLVDPLDGTTNFLRNIPVFAISLTLILDGQPLLGVIHNPVTGEVFHSVREKGAFRNGVRIFSSTITQVTDAVVCIESGKSLASIKSASRQQASWAHKVNKTRNLGSAAVSLTLVSSGGLDAFIVFDVRQWDVAAGALLASEAGALITQAVKGDSLTGDVQSIVASTASIHSVLVAGLESPIP